MNWWLVMLVGFVLAIIPTILWQVWNGLSLLGVCICLLAGYSIMTKEMDDV